MLSYRADTHRWPDDGYTGRLPSGLDPYLPEGFSLNRAGFRLDWENWDLPGGLPGAPDLRGLLGISVVTSDRELGQAELDLVGGSMPSYVLGDSCTFLIERK